MSSISVSDSTKTEFDELKPDNLTHDEFVLELLSVYKQQDTELALEELSQEIINAIDDELATKAELASYRGTKDAIESTILD